MGRERKPLARLAKLAASLERFESLVRQGAAADLDQVRSAVADLTKRVCQHPPDFRAAARMHGQAGVTHGGHHYASFTEALYVNALGDYQQMMERTTGFGDDELEGFLEPDKVVAQWPAIVADLQPILLAPQELAQLIAAARQEAGEAKPLPPPPLPTIYSPPGESADRWSQAVAQEQAARLAAYREGAVPPRSVPPGEYGATDRLTFAHKGEPPDRFVTKIGGLPYRPKSALWPVRPSGQPMVFLAQFCFADSTDLVGPLPGAVLVIFARDEEAFVADFHDEEPAFRFEWYPLGLEELVSAAEVPASSWKLLPCYARVEREAEEADGIEGSKIGGSPHWIQGEVNMPGQFLAVLGQVRLNESPEEHAAGHRYLKMADFGLLNFFL
jgi:hypothetical protein